MAIGVLVDVTANAGVAMTALHKTVSSAKSPMRPRDLGGLNLTRLRFVPSGHAGVGYYAWKQLRRKNQPLSARNPASVAIHSE